MSGKKMEKIIGTNKPFDTTAFSRGYCIKLTPSFEGKDHYIRIEENDIHGLRNEPYKDQQIY